MDHPPKGSISLPHFTGKTKILFSEWPGKVGLLMEEGRPTAKKFRDAHAALDWCIKHKATFYFMPPAPVGRN